MDESPYQSPQAYQQAPIVHGRKPSVVTWYNVYVTVLLLIYLGLVVMGLVFALFAQEFASSDPNADAVEFIVLGTIFAIMGLGFSAITVIGLLVPRKKWGWIYGIVLICLGLTSGCTLIPAVFLLIFWLKPETKAYFNMQP